MGENVQIKKARLTFSHDRNSTAPTIDPIKDERLNMQPRIGFLLPPVEFPHWELLNISSSVSVKNRYCIKIHRPIIFWHIWNSEEEKLQCKNIIKKGVKQPYWKNTLVMSAWIMPFPVLAGFSLRQILRLLFFLPSNLSSRITSFFSSPTSFLSLPATR